MLFPVGVILVALGFAAHVGHAVMLANGRRAMPAVAVAPQPAFAGAVTGSFVTSSRPLIGLGGWPPRPAHCPGRPPG